MNTVKPCSFDCAYYDENYPSYERQNPPRKLHHYAALVERHLPSGVPRRLHDIGCAFGKFAGTLERDWEVYGSDVSEFAIARASEAYPHASFCVADNSLAPAFSEKFGAVTALDVLEHVPQLDALGRSIEEQLVPGGIFVFVVPVYDGLSGPVIRLLDKDLTHIHKWGRGRWLEWARGLFSVVEWHGILRYLLPWKSYLHVPTKIFRGQTPAILVVCRKPQASLC